MALSQTDKLSIATMIAEALKQSTQPEPQPEASVSLLDRKRAALVKARAAKAAKAAAAKVQPEPTVTPSRSRRVRMVETATGIEPDGTKIVSRFGTVNVKSSERRQAQSEQRISEADAKAMIAKDPDRKALAKMSADDWRWAATSHRRGNPANLTVGFFGSDCQVSMALATGKDSYRLQLRGLDVIRKLRAAGIDA